MAIPPDDLIFTQEWRRVVLIPDGQHIEKLDSNWYGDESLVRSMLNDEYPEPTSTGFGFVLQTRWVSEARSEH